jgi:hypothetical protein
MALLGSTTVVDSRTGRKLNNANTLEFKTAENQTLALAVQRGSIGVLFGFRNGGSGAFTITGSGGELHVDCRAARTTVTDAAGAAIGTIEPQPGGAAFKGADGTTLARLAGQPSDQRLAPSYSYGLTDASGGDLGTITLLRSPDSVSLLNEIDEQYLWRDRAGQPLKAPTFGTQLALRHPVDGPLGDLLLATCVDVALGAHGYVTEGAPS